MRATVVLATISLLAVGCGEDATTSPDLSVGPPDLGDTLTLTVGASAHAMAAYYSFYVDPLPSTGGPGGTFLVVSAVDPAFDCAQPSPDLDVLGFLFMSRTVGASTSTVASRRGPTFGPTIGGDVSGSITAEADRFTGYDVDAGAVFAGDDGVVAGRLRFVDGAITLAGKFVAHHCATLDVIVPD
jgi:hypothetical protein